MAIQNIPKSLQTDGQFCVWKYIERDGKRTKCPFNPSSGTPCASNDHSTFGSFSHARAAAENGGYDGIGIGIFGNVCAIDLDDCVDADRHLSKEARDIILTMKSYTELSPSGKGVHILFRARDFSYDKAKYYINNQSEGIEAYIAGATNKFVTITGQRINGWYTDLEERGKELSVVLERYMKRKDWDASDHLKSMGPGVDLTDEEVVQLVVEHSDRFGPILDGDLSAYDYDQSRADMALCAKLAFYTRDPEQIDRIYRNSGLGRTDGKWDRKQSGSTYGRLTIEKALNLVTEQYRSYQAKDAAQVEQHKSITEQIRHAQERAASTKEPNQNSYVISSHNQSDKTQSVTAAARSHTLVKEH